MATIDVREFSDSFVIHYGGKPNEVDAFTFANSLISIGETLRSINAIVNPETSIEISIDALSRGSFRARIKSTAKSLLPIFRDSGVQIVSGVLVLLICQKILAPDEPHITIEGDVYIVERNGDRIILRKEIYDMTKRVERDETVSRHLSRAFEALQRDPSVTDFGITRHIGDPTPVLDIPREDFGRFAEPPAAVLVDAARQVPTGPYEDHETEVVVIRAIFERGTRKWQFAWRGNKISAPILDRTVFDRLESRDLTLATGDILRVKLRVYKKLDPATSILLNDRYEVVEFYEHKPRPRQHGLIFDQ